jgi:uncharacterized protein
VTGPAVTGPAYVGRHRQDTSPGMTSAPGRPGEAVPDGTLAAQLVVIAKEPVPGLVKTRLTPPYTPAEAAAVAEAALADTLEG